MFTAGTHVHTEAEETQVFSLRTVSFKFSMHRFILRAETIISYIKCTSLLHVLFIALECAEEHGALNR